MAERPLAGRRVVEVLATSAGGVGTHVRALLPVLREAGADVGVCGAPATEELFGFTATGADFTPVGISTGLAPAADARAVLQLRRALAGADLVHAHGLRAGLVAAAALRVPGGRGRSGPRPPLVLTLHNALQEGGGRLRGALQALERLTVRGADLVLAVSSDLAANARRAGAPDVRVAPALAPPLAPAQRGRAEVRAELGLPDGRPLVVAVGRLHPQKGYDVLLDAVSRWSGRESAPLFAVAGDGPLQDELAARIAAERLPVVLLGRRSDVADLLGAADVCVLPSRWEGSPFTAQEALRAGTPLVSTRAGGIPELVGEGAVLVPVGDAAALADALEHVLTDPAHAAALAEAGRRQASQWPDDAGAGRRVAAVYRELLGAPAAGSR
ncbi:Glycosyltransferase involved in cell wall bisynthesis [Blastococcus aggregatus]|uniref:Glycosyltransferase involved in cell wall bisynthesis n=1 Tax=Blastococcus aggregatus TaxID=38502 RepID=A0A285V5W8_9ACTN|nr:glycosyltransferase family 4 protein [Blastococcus aggregatus]SOC49327.1 Glycosyltransferase involved in cell wall bisynthesis [Blastococcus aggregatus]